MKWFVIQFALSFVGFAIAFGVLYPMIGKMTSKGKRYESEYDIKSVLLISAIASLVTALLRFLSGST